MQSLAAHATLEVGIKRSRFIAHAARVDTQPDTLAFFQAVADPAATHNCWAWKLGARYRLNDDGEPAGTAGRPILGAIEGKGLDHAMIVVTRHFGGIKLGTGGLVRAYRGVAARCIDLASLVEILPEIECTIEADYCWTGQIYAALEACRADRLEEAFAGGGLRIRLRIAEPAFAELQSLLKDTTRGEAAVRKAVGK